MTLPLAPDALPPDGLALVLAPHAHGHGGGLDAGLLVVGVLAVAALAYVSAARAERSAGRRSWPWWRDALWLSGLAIVAAAFVGPLAAAAHGDPVAHMVAHLTVGMLAPVLLVCSAPVTLALRSVAVQQARRLSRLLGSRPVRLLSSPPVAAVLTVWPLWVLYASPWADAAAETMRDVPLAHELVLLHFLTAGCLFTASVLPIDPSPHRASFPVRLAVLFLAVAAHSITAKLAFASPPTAWSQADGERAALVMYYGGDAIELVLIVLVFARWYRAAGRSLARERAAVVAP